MPTPTLHTVSPLSAERGSAIIIVLLLLMLLSALTAALVVSGQTETLVVRNHISAAHALTSAEAGLNHAVQVVIDHIADAYVMNGADGVRAAIDLLLTGADVATDADNGDLAALGLPLGVPVMLSASSGTSYEVRLFDEDDPAREGASDLQADSDDGNDEDGDPQNDLNDSVVVRAVGYARDGAMVVLEAILAPDSFPAVVTNADLEISGNPTISGDGGSVHTNSDLSLSGNPEIQGDATATGSFSESGNPDVGGSATGDAAEVDVPAVNPADHLSKADFILQSTGQLTLPNGTVLCDAGSNNSACKAAYGWEFNNPGWNISGNSAADGTFYVEGTARVSGNPGDAADPAAITIIAEGSIEISGNPDLTPDTAGLMFVAGGDLKLSGNPRFTGSGQMLVHEQVQISGNAEIEGQILVEDGASSDSMVTENRISGNPEINYDGELLSGTFNVTGWRQIR